jgi:hypothetical protein
MLWLQVETDAHGVAEMVRFPSAMSVAGSSKLTGLFHCTVIVKSWTNVNQDKFREVFS